jgi:DNA-binding PadR family transcriptional regulator
MKIEDIYNFFQHPRRVFLNLELTVCYILSILLEHDSYGSELVEHLEHQYVPHHLSDTVLFASLRFLESEGLITSYWKKVVGRGRPRRMYQIQEQSKVQATELAQFWKQYISQYYCLPDTFPSEIP